MAPLSLAGGEGKFSWRITELSSGFSQANGYVEAGITEHQFTQAASQIYGIVDSVSAPTTGSSTSTSRRTVYYSPGTYIFWAYTLAQNGTYYPAGSGTVTITEYEEPEPSVPRPNNWSWWSNIYSDAPISITAAEYNAFTDRINQFREYKGLSRYNFTMASSGSIILASMVGQCSDAISAMDPVTSPPYAPYAGDEITARFFNRLMNALNSID